ncbi:MAG: FAD-dependent thymidylate synthase [Clostridia bacterium]|nr:FAD-dependent thymidylate synthase [Clostridia bacterium]
MKVYLNEISGLWQAIVSMYMSKRSWTREHEEKIMRLYEKNYTNFGMHFPYVPEVESADFEGILNKLFKWAPRHITMTRFLDFSFTVEGLHRGAQDDFDAHAKRLENRILRSSTRLAKFGGNEKSDWYKGKIITTDEALKHMEMHLPAEMMVDGKNYVRAVNGYVLEESANDKDVLRGLYMLSIPSNFTFKVNCTEFAHILKERDKNGHAHPELKECVEEMLRLITEQIPQLTREWFYSVKN